MYQMSLEQLICKFVKQHWHKLNPEINPPDSLVIIKVAGKPSPNAAIIVLVLDALKRSPVAIAKIPRNPNQTIGIENEYAAMVDLNKSLTNSEVSRHIPYQGLIVENSGCKILLQRAGHGIPMTRAMTSEQSVTSLYEMILPWMVKFNADRAIKCVLAGNLLKDLVTKPIAEFFKQYPELCQKLLSPEAKQFLGDLPEKVEGQKLCLCRQHGDFNAHNLLIEMGKGSITDFTLIDWEDYRILQLPIHDLNHFFISNSKVLESNMSIQDSFTKLIVQKGWYQDLYSTAIKNYTAHHLIDFNTFQLLIPLYLISMCLKVSESQRQQAETAHVWIQRADQFIKQRLLS